MDRMTTISREPVFSSAKLASGYPILWLLPLLLVLLTAPASAQIFVRGDANSDGDIDFYVGDAVSILSYLYAGGCPPPCEDAADGNDDGNLNIADPFFILDWRASAIPLPAPFPSCGVDPTADSLGCAASCPTFSGYISNPGFQLEAVPVGGGSGNVGAVITVKVELTVPAGHAVDGVSFGVRHNTIGLQLLPSSVASGPITPDYFRYQSHSTGFNVNQIPSFFLASSFMPGVHVIAEAQYEILTPGVHSIDIASMTGMMPVPVALAGWGPGTGACHDSFAPATVASTITGNSEFVRGDANVDGNINVIDIVKVLNHAFGINGVVCDCEDACDSNDDGQPINIADAIYLVSYILNLPGSTPPPPPFPGCGPDPTFDPIGCASFSLCP